MSETSSRENNARDEAVTRMSTEKRATGLLARQDVKERESSDDGKRRSDDSYSPRRHWCSI